MKELELKYGCNPNQKPARIYSEEGDLPLEVLNGKPGYINFLDALNSWQLVRALKAATGLPAAASFKHVSPAGAALGLPLSEEDRKVFFAPEGDLSPMACAYIRARGTERICSFGDWAALSDTCDEDTARFLALEVSDGIIAPGYTPKALEILKGKRKGTYNIVRIDPDYEPNPIERRSVYGVIFEQGYNDLIPDEESLQHIVTQNKNLPENAKHDMLLSLITLKYTQSNSVCFVSEGQTMGVGAGQQSRIHCTRLAGSKADTWWLRRHPYVLDLEFVDGIRRPDRDNAIELYINDTAQNLRQADAWREIFKVCPPAMTPELRAEWLAKRPHNATCGSDAFFPFSDNIERAAESGVKYIAQPGGSIRDDLVIEAADRYNMVMVFTGTRLFHH